MKFEQLSQNLIRLLEQRRSKIPYSFVLYFLLIGIAMISFAILGRNWFYGIEGTVIVAAGIVFFIIEVCWRRIEELKAFLSESRRAERSEGFETSEPAKEEAAVVDVEPAMDLADNEQQSVARGVYEQFELLS